MVPAGLNPGGRSMPRGTPAPGASAIDGLSGGDVAAVAGVGGSVGENGGAIFPRGESPGCEGSSDAGTPESRSDRSSLRPRVPMTPGSRTELRGSAEDMSPGDPSKDEPPGLGDEPPDATLLAPVPPPPPDIPAATDLMPVESVDPLAALEAAAPPVPPNPNSDDSNAARIAALIDGLR